MVVKIHFIAIIITFATIAERERKGVKKCKKKRHLFCCLQDI